MAGNGEFGYCGCEGEEENVHHCHSLPTVHRYAMGKDISMYMGTYCTQIDTGMRAWGPDYKT